ncbi:MAG: YggS family pyridoxal phosphate-dependent enzyme [Gammaproteobacteria bacterium]|nr:YggS family pyridoxal phosphate-dependent enzyme [Gammaproteobacteria bacterium]
MQTLVERLNQVRGDIDAAERKYARVPGSVQLLAASKAQPVSAMRTLAGLGVRAFGENYVKEGLEKQHALRGNDLEWHFIGHVQSNKTRDIASRFAWVHSVDRIKIAHRLAAQRPPELPPLNVCIEVNIDRQSGKSGVDIDDLGALAVAMAALKGLRLRGLMAIPMPRAELTEQRQAFAQLRRARDRLNRAGLQLDTLSMGMSADLEAAIAEGATIVRIGTALFGPRQ